MTTHKLQMATVCILALVLLSGCDQQKQLETERARASSQLESTVADLNSQHASQLHTSVQAAIAETELRVRKELADEAKLAVKEAFDQGKLVGEQAEKNNYIEQGIAQGKVIGEATGFQKGQESGISAEAARAQQQIKLLQENLAMQQAAFGEKEYERGRLQGQLEGTSENQGTMLVVIAIVAAVLFVSLKAWWKLALDAIRQSEREMWMDYMNDNNRRFSLVLDNVFAKLRYASLSDANCDLNPDGA